MALDKRKLQVLRRGAAAAIDRGVDRAADYGVELADQLAPEDEGDMKATIRKEGEVGSRKRQIVVGGISGPNKFVDYAEHVEYGTDESPAQPFMHPAADAIDVELEVERELQALIRSAT